MYTHAHIDVFTSTGRILGAISRRKEKRMGEDGRRKEAHRMEGERG